MDIKLMEKTYKDNVVVLYVNGFVGAVSNESMMETSAKVLRHLGYNIVDVAFICCDTDEKPNNEANYWHEGDMKDSVILKGVIFTSDLGLDFCPDVEYRISVNGEEFPSTKNTLSWLTELICRLGHPSMNHEDLVLKFSKVKYSPKSDQEKEEEFLREMAETMFDMEDPANFQ